MIRTGVILKAVFLLGISSFAESVKNAPVCKEILISKFDYSTETYAYYDKNGIKKIGDFPFVFTDTLIDYAIVADTSYFLIDRTGKHIYEIFSFDNEPDITKDGLYRIVKNGKIGYADSATSIIIVEPIYDCAFPFEGGRAKVSLNCRNVSDGEHYIWESNDWFYIDVKGNRIK